MKIRNIFLSERVRCKLKLQFDMSKLALINAKRFEKLLIGLGFSRTRQKGSHVVYHHRDGRTVSVPFHSSKDISRQLLRSLLKKIDISVEEYNDLIR